MAQWLGTGPFLVLRQYCRVYYTTVVVNFALFSEKNFKEIYVNFSIQVYCTDLQYSMN